MRKVSPLAIRVPDVANYEEYICVVIHTLYGCAFVRLFEALLVKKRDEIIKKIYRDLLCEINFISLVRAKLCVNALENYTFQLFPFLIKQL